jgi:diguanylate cyclase (GGDEF)-like protein
MAIGGLCLLLLDRYTLEFSRFRQQQQVTETVAVTRGFSSLIHELQKERGMSAGFLASPSPKHRAALIYQQARTDLEITSITKKAAQLNRLPVQLSGLRQQILTGTMQHLEAHRIYSGLIQELLNQIWRLARLSEYAILNDDLIAHVQLMFIKEHLGQIRAKINYTLRTTTNKNETTAEVAELQAIFYEYERQFRRNAASKILVEYDQVFQGQEVDTVLQTMQAVSRSELAPSEISADEWFRLATMAIDRLKEVEDRSLTLITANSEKFLDALRQRLMLYTIMVLLLCSLTLALVVHTVRKILYSLNHLLTEVKRISEQQDFSQQIPVRTHDEIGIITRAFNRLLKIIDWLFKEKDYQAGTDPLTGLINRRRFIEFLDQEIARYQRHSEPLALVMFDIDDFKRVNDMYGHDTGDLVLREIAQLVSSEIRRTDILARWGGEEFMILLPNTTGEAATWFAEKLRAGIESHEFPQVGRATASFGVASLDEKETDGKTLIKHADQAMYTAKQEGRNRVANQYSDYPSCRI